MHPFAQTNVQLYNQLRAAGYGDDDLARVRRAYEYGMGLFSGRYHPCGKPLLAHLVGTASILAAEGLPGTVVAAAVAHAAYGHGDFGDAQSGATEDRRAEVQRALGDEVEALLFGYHELPWGSVEISAWSQMAATSSTAERQQCLLKIADTLENYLDQATCYCAEFRLAPYLAGNGGEAVAALATQLGYPGLADAWRAIVPASNAARAPEALRREVQKAVSIAPRSYRRLPTPIRAFAGALGSALDRILPPRLRS